MNFFINYKTRKQHRLKTVNQFNQQPWEIYQNYFIQDKIQRLNYVVGYLNAKIIRNQFEKID